MDYHREITDQAETWKKFLKGNKEAYYAIFYSYIRLLYNYGNKITADNGLIEDCIQDLFVDLWEKRTQLSETTNIKFYLFRALRRRIVRKLSTQKKLFEEPSLSSNKSEEPISISFELKLVTQQVNQEKSERLLNAVQALSPRQKEVIYLRYYDDLSFQEISGIMGLHIKSAYKLLYKALDKLKVSLGHEVFIFIFALGQLMI